MTRRAFFQHFTAGPGVLRQAGQRVVFTQNTDYGLALTKSCHKSGGDSSHAFLDFETFLTQHFYQQC